MSIFWPENKVSGQYIYIFFSKTDNLCSVTKKNIIAPNIKTKINIRTLCLTYRSFKHTLHSQVI